METRKMIVGMVAVVLVLMSGTAWATQYYVSPDGNDNNSGTTWATAFATIGKGISDANDGDVVDVNEGTYYETINFSGKAIKVRSTDPNDWGVVAATIIDANNASADAVMFASGEGANTGLRGLTVRGASVGVYVDSVGPVISRCILQGNRTGVKYTTNSTGTLIVNNKIHDSNGYGVFGHKGDATIKSNWIYDSDKGIKLASGASADIYNNTIVNNISYGIDKGGGQGVATISNCIIWNCNDDLAGCSATYSCISDCNDASGTGNICGDGNDPNFVDADANDFHIEADSPCLDAGDPCYAPGSNERDIDNNYRVHGTAVDMGADEDPADWYVDDDKVSNGPGTNWDDAFKYLQDALAAAQSGDEIWVAQGIYRPTTSTTDRLASFQIKAGVKIKGGYGGLTFSAPALRDKRDYRLYETILSGDIDGDGVLDNGNSYHVVKFLQGPATAVLDGFTITMGMTGDSTEVPWHEWPDRCGGGVFCWKVASVTISNCVIRDNESHYLGGGMFNYGGSSPTVTNCFFINNKSYDGGGMANYDESGGERSNPTVTNCVFSGNHARKDGGGIYNLRSCPTLINCTFSKNLGEVGSGGMYGSSPTVTNCIFWGNTSRPRVYIRAQQIAIDGGSEVKYSCIQDEDPDADPIPYGGAANNNIDDDPRFVDADNPAGPDGILGTFDDGLRLRPGSPNRCVDSGNNNDIDNTGVTTDVIGNARKMDGDGDGSRTVDRGAYELPRIWYVDYESSCSSNCGTSWATAYKELRDAISDLISKTDGNEIWVADGTYTPGAAQGDSFLLIGGVPIRGGYAGNGATDPYEQDFVAYETVLSGDIGTVGDAADNSYHVVEGIDRGVLEGFTIRGGNAYGTSDADKYGGGVYCDGVSPTISKCKIIRNLSEYGGGGIYCTNNAFPTISHCVLWLNDAGYYYGGGVYSENSTPSVINCTFMYNTAGEGGGMYNINSSSMTISGCLFTGNYASWDYGGGMYNKSSSPTVINCVFTENEAYNGGGMYNDGESTTCEPKLINCVFSGNYANDAAYYGKGGGIYNHYASAELINCTFSQNAALSDGGGGMYNHYASAELINCTFSQNTAWTDGGGMHNYESSSVVTNCIFWGNMDTADPWGVFLKDDEEAQIYGGTPVVTYSCIKDDDPDDAYIPFDGAANHNIDDNPNFKDASLPEGMDGEFCTWDDGLGIMAYSPCVDAANGNVAASDDITGRGRINVPYADNGGVGVPDYVDMGAYESPIVWFVDGAASGGTYNGETWSTAYKYLREALDETVNTDLTSGDEIWVAEGTYKPDEDTSNPGGTGSRSASFELYEGVAVYGGFEGDETKPQKRDWTTFNQTILDGDIGTPGDDLDNSYHVVTGADKATLDGFTIKGGNATDSFYDVGGGIYCEDVSPTISNCVIRDNKAGLYGGGISILYRVCPTNVRNCFFINNTAPDGGGMYNELCYVTVTNCVFSGNDSSQNGGGIYSEESFSSLINCTFSTNQAEGSGGGMYNYNSKNRTWQSTVTNCIFRGNSDCEGMDESAQIHGGAVVNYSCIQGGWSGSGGNNTGNNPLFLNPVGYWKMDEGEGTTAYDSASDNDGTIVEATWTTEGQIDGALIFDGVDDYVDLVSPDSLDDLPDGDLTISAWIYDEQTADSTAGAIFGSYASSNGWSFRTTSNALGQRSLHFRAAHSTTSAECQSNYTTISQDWHHVVAVWNSAGKRARLYIDGSEPDYQTTIAGEGTYNSDASIDKEIGRLADAGGSDHFKGKIDDVMIFNRVLSFSEIKQLFARGSGGKAYDLVAGLDGIFGTLHDGLQLRAKSPCVDAGDNGIVDAIGLTMDILGDERVQDNKPGGKAMVDMGPYELFKKCVYAVTDHSSRTITAYKAIDDQIINWKDAKADAGGPLGLAIDNSSKTLFVTFHGGRDIGIIDVRNMESEGVVELFETGYKGGGIVWDENNEKMYILDRGTTDQLYVYRNWDPDLKTLEHVETVSLTVGTDGALDIALDESEHRLFITDGTTAVLYYNTNDLSATPGEIPMLQEAVGIAFYNDVAGGKKYVYTGGGMGGGHANKHTKLVRTDITNLPSSPPAPDEKDIGEGVKGVSVDPDTGYVYITTSGTPNNIQVYNNATFSSSAEPCDAKTVTNATDIVVGVQ